MGLCKGNRSEYRLIDPANKFLGLAGLPSRHSRTVGRRPISDSHVRGNGRIPHGRHQELEK